MLRFLLFVVAFVVGLALTAPLERWLLPLLEEPLAATGIVLRLDTLRLALPAGLRATGVELDADGAGVSVDSVYVGLTRSFEARACGGTLAGSARQGAVTIRLAGVDPSKCLRIGRLALAGRIDADASVRGFELGSSWTDRALRADIDLRSEGGVLSGYAPMADAAGGEVPIGEWDYDEVVLRGQYERGRFAVSEGRALASGVEWQLLGASLDGAGPSAEVRIDLRARVADDSARAKALIGLMPKATPDADGWRRYRVLGPVSGLRVLGLE